MDLVLKSLTFHESYEEDHLTKPGFDVGYPNYRNYFPDESIKLFFQDLFLKIQKHKEVLHMSKIFQINHLKLDATWILIDKFPNGDDHQFDSCTCGPFTCFGMRRQIFPEEAREAVLTEDFCKHEGRVKLILDLMGLK